MTDLVRIDGLNVDYRRRNDTRSPETEAGAVSRVRFRRRNRWIRVIENMHLSIAEGETLGLVGESGSGKSTIALAVTGLVRAASGSIHYRDSEITGLKGRERRRVQREIQLVFQNPQLSLSPRRRVGWQLHEPLRVHTSLDTKGRQERINEVIGDLRLSSALLQQFPHELSGGQAQRVALARTLVLEPALLLLDEPTSSLDVSVQAGVLNLLQRLKRDKQLTYLFITHDLGVARHVADRIAVMQRGEIVELQDTEELFNDPQHAYTRRLLSSSLTV